MNMLRTIAAIALLLALQACGGGGDAAPEKATVTAAPVCRAVHVRLIGDSTMRGPEDPADPNRPAALLQTELNRRLGSKAVIVSVQAIGGTEVFDVVAGDRGFDRWPHVADLFVMNFGINEAVNGVTIARYEAGLRQVATSPAVMFQTPTPLDTGTGPKGGKPDNAEFAQAMRRIAAEKGLTLIDANQYVAALPGWQDLLMDGIHPGPELYQMLVANVTAPAVAARVASLGCLQ